MAGRSCMMEIWKSIAAFPDYSVSNLGRIRRDTPASGTQPGRILKPQLRGGSNGRRYLSVSFYRHIQRSVHRLVAEAFIPNPLNLPHVNHKNPLERHNNAVGNLEWTTQKDNTQHALKHGRLQKARKKAKHIYQHYGKWRIIIQGQHCGTFKTLQAARNMRHYVLSQKETV